ncbi:hypothetical protein AIT68_005567 [Salmonella enterica subsp. salamae]|uniref:hypothetical protein n=1 Tax=Salmonella enterica TaxID=28901 RepID=UPI0012B74BBD|nr:hypothetical protein [Salmonella enterica]
MLWKCDEGDAFRGKQTSRSADDYLTGVSLRIKPTRESTVMGNTFSVASFFFLL